MSQSQNSKIQKNMKNLVPIETWRSMVNQMTYNLYILPKQQKESTPHNVGFLNTIQSHDDWSPVRLMMPVLLWCSQSVRDLQRTSSNHREIFSLQDFVCLEAPKNMAFPTVFCFWQKCQDFKTFRMHDANQNFINLKDKCSKCFPQPFTRWGGGERMNVPILRLQNIITRFIGQALQIPCHLFLIWSFPLCCCIWRYSPPQRYRFAMEMKK